MNIDRPHARHLHLQPEERNGNGRGILFAKLGTIAAIVIAVPICLGWVGRAYEISKLPERVATVEQSQKEIQESLVRIEGALGIPKERKKKETP